jgi:hypothetical protein
MIEEKRLFPRVNIVCKISTVFDNRLMVFDTHTENLGAAGVRVILEEKLNVATPVDIELFLPPRVEPIKCKGQIAWTSELHPVKIKYRLFYTGVKFTQMSEQDKKEVKDFVELLLSQKE